MKLTRRETIFAGFGAAVATVLPLPALASVDDAVAAFTGGADVGSDGITLNTPEIAENGNTVPIEVSAPGAVSIMILAAGNPNPDVATFNFGPLAASQSASTRIRLAGTQDVIAVAKMADGSFVRTANEVKVTIGGCGG
ncbi:thiosulfate oxidation carrier protein SoxY [Alphaproteobacteria bacterium GH1-50]|uniref:Thiosulfate oxidation carrier protein SoxY n=1 Tax=Kangsaoukella pontilimi TaxID=2691042 RepID=A0A7C9IFQ9_9RHOB|nr:thiosulfate oxidation carrier protein SoxY [Kangsaoukella pontilimi]MXQ07469.1 thiosulfate oxidation carrier protein SoxY [Kangsaoukella pontilimi]